MTDVALVWNSGEGRADLALAAGDLLPEVGLRTAVTISLFTDRLARGDDDVADAAASRDAEDRRGWWGDLPRPGLGTRLIGSRLWLLRRAKATEGTRLRAISMAREALAWMTEDGIVDRVEVEARFGGAPPDRLLLTVTLRRGAASERFDLAWQAEFAR